MAPTVSQPTATQPTITPIDPQPTITPDSPQPAPIPTANQSTAASSDTPIEQLATQLVGPSENLPTAGRSTTTQPTPLQVEVQSSPSSVASQPTPLAVEGELPMIRRPEEPAGRQTSHPVSSSPVPPPPHVTAKEPEMVVAVPDQIAALPDPVAAPPDQVVALPLQPAAQPVGEGPPAVPQPVQPIPPRHDIEKISSKSGEVSVNFIPWGSGMELVAAHRLQPEDESAIGPTTRQGTPMAFRVMAPSEATTVFQSGCLRDEYTGSSYSPDSCPTNRSTLC
ncbi:flocculation protein FLO11-like [Andrographis paniculata]|uniref:flocculation protein FLO11-like n=1 Tax=Andrographis paniculata TaxID=175694 RepID=UPI0021E980F9|nr:flocculation protein FLO11-like [Andrographis paniculata]